MKTCGDCKECKAIKGKLYCGRYTKELVNGRQQDGPTILYVKRDDKCRYSK